jgi:hypothetical protein
MPACFSEQGGSHRRGEASAPQANGDFSDDYQETTNRETTECYQKQKCFTIVEEVEKFEDLGTRMQELLLTSPKGTRIYLRVRKDTTIN